MNSDDLCEWCPDNVGPTAGGGELWHKDADGNKVSDGIDTGWTHCAKKWMNEHPEVAQGTAESHPGTNCCADFRCCIEAVARDPNISVFAALAVAAKDGSAVVFASDPDPIPE